MLTTLLLEGDGLKFSGHETFACRHAWLPKAYRALLEDPRCFNDEDAAIAMLGLGKNMVRSCKFWAEAVGLAIPEDRGMQLTDFGHFIFADDGFDPFLEDVRTLWLLHWRIASRLKGGLFAWRFLINHWPYPELTRSEALAAFERASAEMGYNHSSVTLSQHLDVFLHTYRANRSASSGIEDSLDGPLVGLALIERAGERRGDNGRWETIYAFRRDPKPDVSTGLFEWCLSDFWARTRPGEETMTLREAATAPCSPGQVFKLSEDDVRNRLEAFDLHARRPFVYQPSAVQGLISRRRGAELPTLQSIYNTEV